MTPSPADPVPPPLHAAVFASGDGSNFQALLDHAALDHATFGGTRDSEGAGSPWRCSLLVSDRPDAGALARAERAGIPIRVIPVAQRDSQEVAEEILAALQSAGIRLLLLAGYVRLIPPQVVRAFRGRILNVHPSLLPAFGGKGMYGHRIHEAVLAHGVRVTGVTVHLADEEYDRGRILAQWPVPVLPGDDAKRLATRVLEVEHRLYPRVVDHLARSLLEGREPTPMVTPSLPMPSI
ncbi:MAG: phosphoribosylglycinamide formyltransferase [Gemmatimonadales bacterium]|nr:MAG: phosphoribosylglycinamide formyltransferase [Gemmatimonadales bacterium]